MVVSGVNRRLRAQEFTSAVHEQMELSGRSPAGSAQTRILPIIPILAMAAALLALLLVGGALGGPLVRVVAACAGVWFVHRGWREATGRERRVRAWVLAGMAIWLMAELGRVIGLATGRSALIVELSIIGLAIAAIGAYVASARRRMRAADETALYLDAIAICAATTGGVIVIGGSLARDPIGLAVLAHAAFFLALVAATLLLHLTTNAPLRFAGQWEMLSGLTLGAAGYAGLLLQAPEPMRTGLHVVVAAAALLGGHGGGRWSAATQTGHRYTAVATWLRGLLPLTSVIATAMLVITLITNPALVEGPLRIVAAAALAIVVVCAIARQTVLLRDREQVIGREHQLTDELTVAEAQYRSVVERVPGVVYVAESGQYGRWHFVSAKIEELLGFTPEEWVADPKLWVNRIHPGDRDRMVLAETEDATRTEAVGRWEYRLIAKDGRVVWVIDDEAVISRDVDGHPTMVQGILVDISDRKDLEDQLRHQALHDPLTGLPNRVLFVDRLSHALVRRHHAGVAVLFVDLDDFKAINDTLGHASGDDLLRLVADRLAGVLRAEDTACRIGGDEFAFLLEGADRMLAERVARRLLSALAEPFHLAGREATLTASVGVAVGDASFGNSTAQTADEILRDADTAMYVAKGLGKGLVEVFERGMEEPIERRRELRTALERALDVDDQLVLEYQPIVDMRTAGLLGLEALVRWNHPQLGRLMPAEFVPLAEEMGIIGRLGEWVLRRACTDLARRSVLVSVNVSAHQLGDGALAGLVEDALARSGLPPSRLLLELTEGTLASAGAGAETELLSVKQLGVRIALDDFGSGYSSLEYLGRLPIDVLKIDRSLVERVHEEPQRQEVMRAIGHIADKLNLETIVEGVEHEAQRQMLLSLGFRRAQGFLFSRAVPLVEALAPFEGRRAS